MHMEHKFLGFFSKKLKTAQKADLRNFLVPIWSFILKRVPTIRDHQIS